ncbi:MAG TPA: peptide chain release factor 1 [Spirochaetota bacterium]|nr:peptide chain release factor 1 [Spirochaetota bacterium]HOM37584.1 peptide chain release factor 1 [Spirochaetota bacterium]HPQ49445.1 peptide chain release factor 1 [Spirochaetota bacterium]
MVDYLERLIEPLIKRYKFLESEFSSGNIDYSSPDYFQINKEYKWLEKIINLNNEYNQLMDNINELKDMLKIEKDDEMLSLIQSELSEKEKKLLEIEEGIKYSIIPPDPNEGKNIIVEIRAGAGGDEAGIFAGDLFRMYNMFCESKGLIVEIIDSNPEEAGGYKEIVFGVKGENAYGLLKFESGVHRVQRVPKTEAAGRIHTSTVTVAVLPEVGETEVKILPDEIKVETTRSQGAGGQHVNKTESAVKITHLPTGIIVHCQDERSQHKNREKAMRILRAKLKELYDRQKKDEIDTKRKNQVGSGERSEKIRTYNYPQNRVTDHRINFTVYNLDQVMNGYLDEIIEKLNLVEREEIIKDLIERQKVNI